MTGEMPVQQLGDAVTFKGADVLQSLRGCINARIRQCRLNGESPMKYARVLAAIHDALMSDCGHDVAESVADQQHSKSQDGDDWMSITEAAEALDLSGRQVRRLAPRLSGVRVGASWVLPKAPVLALAKERERNAGTER